MKLTSLAMAIALLLPVWASAADVTVAPASGSGFVVKDASNTTDRLRVNEDGTVWIPILASGAQQATPVCSGTGGVLGPCAPASGGGSYVAGTGLALSGTTFSIAPSYQIPQSCTANQVAQWSGSAWGCATMSGGFTLPYSAAQSDDASVLFSIANSGKGGTAQIAGTDTASFHSALEIDDAGKNSALIAQNTNGGNAITAYATGGVATGSAGSFVTSSAGNTDAVVSAYTSNGLGTIGQFQNGNATNNADTLDVESNGTGRLGYFKSTNTSSTAIGVEVYVGTNADGAILGSASKGVGVEGESNTGLGVHGLSSSGIGVEGASDGSSGMAFGVYGYESSPSGFAVVAETNSIQPGGTGLVVFNASNSGNMAIFSSWESDLPFSSAFNVARIDTTGKGFFDGGTQTGGADLAEFVSTTGSEPQPGDVVEIDPAQSDRFRLCSEANTTRVAGVISTMPGVTMNDATGADHAANGPALALAGRVPVKATNANGAIRIGDLLVASNVAGHAQRAPIDPAPGTVIGKALQNFDQADGSIQMLVWAH